MGGFINSQFPRGLLCTWPWAAIWWWQHQETEAEAQGTGELPFVTLKINTFENLEAYEPLDSKDGQAAAAWKKEAQSTSTRRLPSLFSCLSIDTASPPLHLTAMINMGNGLLYSPRVYSF